MPWMRAPYTSVVNSLTGHCIAAAADEIVHVPEDVFEEAKGIGWVLHEAPAEEETVEAPKQLSDNVTESPSVEVDDFQVELDQAVLRVITRNLESDFKPDGKPKVNSVVAEMSPDVKKRPSAGQIGKTFERMQDNVNLSDV